jgi:dTDP-4-dehydrorhamnose reductase
MRGAEVAGEQTKNLVIVGANGMLAQAVRIQAPGCYRITCLDLPEFDLTHREQVLGRIRDIAPAVIINCAAYTNVDGCETNEETATAVNGLGPGHLAEAAIEVGATLVHISTDYVFDGRRREPYTEEDATNPLSAYGRSKLKGEQAILESGLEQYFILRTSWLYGPGGKNFVETIIRLANEKEELRIVADQVGTPTFTADLARAIFNLVEAVTSDKLQVASNCPSLVTRNASPPFGIYHFADGGECSWYEFGKEIVSQLAASGATVKAQRILPISTGEYPLPAVRPAYSVFSKEKYRRATGAVIPDWRESLATYFRTREG